jgi:hypothetical protein
MDNRRETIDRMIATYSADYVELLELAEDEAREDFKMVWKHEAEIAREIVLAIGEKDIRKAIGLIGEYRRVHQAFEEYLLDCMMEGEFQ